MTDGGLREGRALSAHAPVGVALCQSAIAASMTVRSNVLPLHPQGAGTAAVTARSYPRTAAWTARKSTKQRMREDSRSGPA